MAAGNMAHEKMELQGALKLIPRLYQAGVTGVSFTAGEPLLYQEDIGELLKRCRELGMFTRVVTNGFWASDRQRTRTVLSFLKHCGLNQLRLSFSRWHQCHVEHENILRAAQGCNDLGIDYFISFITDHTSDDDAYEDYLRGNELNYFPESLIYSGRAGNLKKSPLSGDFTPHCCHMNPYIAPDYTMFGCCDGGVHFTATDFFSLGTLIDTSVEELLLRYDQNPLYRCIREIGISRLALNTDMRTRDIVTYRKCDLCRKLFNSHDTVDLLRRLIAEGTVPLKTCSR